MWGVGGQWRAALGIYESMDGQGLRQDAITCSSLISALAKGKQWALALQVPCPIPNPISAVSNAVSAHHLLCCYGCVAAIHCFLADQHLTMTSSCVGVVPNFTKATVGNHNLVAHLAVAGVQLLWCTTLSHRISPHHVIMGKAHTMSIHMFVAPPWSVVAIADVEIMTVLKLGSGV